MKQCTRCTPQDAKIFWNLSQANLAKLENNFKKILKLKSSSCGIPNASLKTLDGYLFQYIGVYTGGKRFIYINAFHGKDTKDVWKKEPVNACDGGTDFWGVLFDPEDLEFSQL